MLADFSFPLAERKHEFEYETATGKRINGFYLEKVWKILFHPSNTATGNPGQAEARQGFGVAVQVRSLRMIFRPLTME